MVQLENLGIRTIKLIKSMIRDKWDNTLAATKDWIDNHPSIVNNVCVKSYPNDQGLHPSLALAAVVEWLWKTFRVCLITFFSLYFLFPKTIFYFQKWFSIFETKNLVWQPKMDRKQNLFLKFNFAKLFYYSAYFCYYL